MTTPLLSILIPTVEDRKADILRLRERIFPQVKTSEKSMLASCGDARVYPYFFMWKSDLVEVIECRDDKTLTIGEKRELMYKEATGLYSWQIDDDDDIADNAIELILEAIKSNPDVDVVSFEEFIDIDGKIERSNHSLAYGDWEGEGGKELWDGFHYHRTPFFKSVIKTEIARSVPIPHIRFGEDHQWAQALKPHLKTEVHIEQQLYKYIHRSTPHNERYGLDKL